jgi:glycosyltransferase involved in cell wall biosynthesis
MKTIISHFYNEEYLLPWWLNHHKQFFDHGVLIDYHSTDNSASIIKEICPTWDVIPSKNPTFDALKIDEEVEYYENQYDGWKIALNTTEFLHGNFSALDNISSDYQFMIPSLVFVDDPNQNQKYPSVNIPLHKQITTGLPITNSRDLIPRYFRSFHNFNIKYPLGRHFWPAYSVYGLDWGTSYGWRSDERFRDEHPLKTALSSEFMIFYYGFAPYNRKILDRRLQIQTRIPENNKENGIGTHHIFDQQELMDKWTQHYEKSVNLTDMMSIYISKQEYLDILNSNQSEEIMPTYDQKSIQSFHKDTTGIFSNLCEIAIKYKSDKCPYVEGSTSGHRHPYTPIYDSYFSHFRNKPINVGEIGIENNDSISIWRDYFPSANIYGFEYFQHLIDSARDKNLPGVHYELMNVCDEISIRESFKKVGVKYDILIDDSTHFFDDQIRIIKNAVEYLNPGGILIIEDIFRAENENRYSEEIQSILKYFSEASFITAEHQLRNSEGWDNDKLLVLVRNEVPFEKNSKVFIITPSRRPFNTSFISNTIPQECEWVVVFDKTVKNEYSIDNATVVKSNETGFWGNPNRNIGIQYIKEYLNPSDNDWIYILDDDNVIHPNWWNSVQPHLNTDSAIITWGQVWPTGEPRTTPTDDPKIATIDTSQYMVRWNVAKNLNFEYIYEADGIYAEEAAKRGKVLMLNQYLGYYNFLRSHKYGQEIRTNICMISMFKNESKGIRRMLESVWRHIDFYVFQDNGSTDGTPEIVKEFFADKNIPGFIYNIEEGWVGFGWNRDHLLQTTLQSDHGCDWIMKMDCDEYLEVDDDFDWSYFYNTDIQSFHVTAQNPGCMYYRAWIWNAKLPWKFQHDPAHEIIYLDDERGENFERVNLPRGLRMIGTNDGESYTVPTKYISDALKLEEKMIREGTLLTDTYHFWYIAKSYQDCYVGNFYPLEEAHSKEFARRYIFYFEEYLNFIKPQGIHEMSYFAAFSIGLGHKYLGDVEKAIWWFNESEKYCPVRNEHIVYLAITYQELQQYEKMLEQTTKLIQPERKLPFPDYYFLIDTNFYYDSGSFPQELHNFALSNVTEEKTIGSFSVNIQTKPRIWIVDDFYDDPYAVREFALKQEFEENLNYYKGRRTKQQFIVPGTKEAFEKIIGKKITNWTETHGMCGRFQYCTAEDDLVYHCDSQTLAGMIYLTPDAPFSCGTSLFAHKRTRLRNENDFGDVDVFGETGFYDRTKFELVDTAGNVFNRLVLFDAKCIHSANEYFGTDITNSRLFHLFFFD